MPGEPNTNISQLYQLLVELVPGGAKTVLSAAQATTVLATVRPRDAAGKARRRVAAELTSDLARVYTRSKAADNQLEEVVAATGSTLLDLHAIGPSGAARMLVEIGDISRFPQPRPLRSKTLPSQNNLVSPGTAAPLARPPITAVPGACALRCANSKLVGKECGSANNRCRSVPARSKR